LTCHEWLQTPPIMGGRKMNAKKIIVTSLHVFKLGKITSVEDQAQMPMGVRNWQWKNSWEICRGGDPLQESLPGWSYNVESPVDQIEMYSLQRHVKSLEKRYSSLSSENQQIIVK
jgi:hypothetical protein